MTCRVGHRRWALLPEALCSYPSGVAPQQSKCPYADFML